MNKPLGALPQSAPLETLAQQLEASGDYTSLCRLRPRTPSPRKSAADKIGIIIDLETTGLDSTKDKVIKLGMVKFGSSDTDEITQVSTPSRRSISPQCRPLSR